MKKWGSNNGIHEETLDTEHLENGRNDISTIGPSGSVVTHSFNEAKSAFVKPASWDKLGSSEEVSSSLHLDWSFENAFADEDAAPPEPNEDVPNDSADPKVLPTDPPFTAIE